MPPRRYALDTSAQAPTASQYSKTLQSKTPAKRPFQQASNTTNCGTGEAKDWYGCSASYLTKVR
ncbi:hypothetical protein J010_00366 [Cryptococcus neoformans]|nr:hypothetical protein C353_00393 [Cryptococcus neoformans var. grubii AD1-83a]OXG41574.1 hypothetical protein C359_02980 [Cryptococcus neoformans var. grubii Bt120]OXG73228.1 hypothetical protein C352_00393 [Cryptococcus neoformans var. grubii CHC193]OXH19340.1 hypothetical protein J010_00366 [Cryptococcus neoformans var. grubii]